MDKKTKDALMNLAAEIVVAPLRIYAAGREAYQKLEESGKIDEAKDKFEEFKNSDQVKQAKENYELSYGRYRVGEASPVELRDAQVTYQEAQFDYYNTLYGYNSAKAALEKAIGKNLVNEKDIIELKPKK